MIKNYLRWCWYLSYGQFKNKWDGPIILGAMIKDYLRWCWYLSYGQFKNKWDGPIVLGAKFILGCIYFLLVLCAFPLLFPVYALGRVIRKN